MSCQDRSDFFAESESVSLRPNSACLEALGMEISTYKNRRFTWSSTNKYQIAIQHSLTGHHLVLIAKGLRLIWGCWKLIEHINKHSGLIHGANLEISVSSRPGDLQILPEIQHEWAFAKSAPISLLSWRFDPRGAWSKAVGDLAIVMGPRQGIPETLNQQVNIPPISLWFVMLCDTYPVGRGYLPVWKMMEWKSVGVLIPNIWKKKTCSKPPTS